MAIAFVRNCPAVGATGNIALVTPAAGHAAGNLLVVPVSYVGVGASGVTDAKGNVYSKKASITQGANVVTCDLWSCKLATGLASGDLITVAGTATGRATADEFSGVLDIVDVFGAAAFASGSVLGSCATGTPTNANDLVYAAIACTPADFVDLVTTGYTASAAGMLTPGQLLRAEYVIQSARTARNTNTGGPQWGATPAHAICHVAFSDSPLAPPAGFYFTRTHPGPRYG